MAVREIPTSYEHKCDGCGRTELSSSKSRPKFWCDLIIAQDAYDYQGCAVADGTIRRLLCNSCKTAITAAVNSALKPGEPHEQE